MTGEATLIRNAQRQIVRVFVPNAVTKGSLVLNVRDYGLLGNGSVESTTALYAAINATTAGTTVLFPPTSSYYNLASPLPNKPYVTYKGLGTGSEVRVSSGSLLAPSTVLEGIRFESIMLSTVGSHLIDLGSGSAGLANGGFRGVHLVTYIDSASVIHGTGGVEFLGMHLRDSFITRNGSATVPAVDLTSSAGALNSNSFDTVTIYSNNCTTTPAIRFEGTLAAYCHDNEFANIIGEQCRGGIVHVYSPDGVLFDRVVGWDASGNYMDHIVKVDTSATTGGKTPRGVRVRTVGTRYGTLNSGSVKHFYCPTVPGSVVSIEDVGDPNGTSAISYIVGQSVKDPWGAAGSIQLVTTNYTLAYTIDGTCLFSGTTLTATLPAPSAAPYAGRKFTVKNIHASSALTVNATGGANVDGAASQSLAAGVVKTYITDGAAWYSV